MTCLDDPQRAPTPLEKFIFRACALAAGTAAIAPIWDNNPTAVGIQGFAIGLLAGLPAFIHRVRRS